MNVNDLIVGLRNGFSELSSGSGAIVGALVLVAVAFLLLVVFYVLYLSGPKGKLESLLEERAEEATTASPWPARLLVVGVIVAAFLLTDVYIGRAPQCMTCHTEADYPAGLAATAHDDLSCISCHRSPGLVTGRVSQVAAYARWILVYTSQKGDPEPRPGSVDGDSCLACHREVRYGVQVSNGIRVRHSDFLQEGAKCRECHNSVAHQVIEPTEPGMEKCVVCHDGDNASSECETCHVEEVLVASSDLERLPKVKNLDTGDCYSCHEESPCLSCHGITMPHPDDFFPDVKAGKAGGHALPGFTNREVCWRCHHEPGKPFVASDESCSCHGLLGKMHGGEPWVKEHGAQATGRKAGQYADCFMCHSDDLCSDCHPASYRQLYNPLPPGPDNYSRDIPHDPFYFDY